MSQKRDRLASAHQDVREEMGHQHQHAVARLEDQHGRLLSDTRQVLTLLSMITDCQMRQDGWKRRSRRAIHNKYIHYKYIHLYRYDV